MSGFDFGALQIDPTTGRTTISPKVSGLDPKEMVTKIMEAKTAIATQRPEKLLTTIDEKAATLSEFEGLVKSYQNALFPLKGVAQGLFGVGSLGKYTVQALTALNPGSTETAPMPAASLIDIQTTGGTDPLSFTLQVNRLAQQDRLQGTQQFGDATVPLNATGTITIPGATPTTITVTPSMGLNDIIQAVNAQTSTTNIIANRIMLSQTQNILTFESTKTGTPLSLTYSSDLIQSLGNQLPPDTHQCLSLAGEVNAQAALNVSGNFQLGPNQTPLAVSTSDSLQSIMNTINKQTSTTNVQATLVTMGPYDHRLMLSTTDGSTLQISSDPSLQVPFLPANSSTRQTLLSADLLYQGASVVRSSNLIGDLIPNATLTLLQADPETTINGAFVPPVNQVTENIQEWMDQHNKMIDFMRSDKAVKQGFLLKDSPTIRAINNTLNATLSAPVDGLSSQGANNLGGIGIRLSDGKLSIDATKDPTTGMTTLATQLSNNFTQVRQVLAFDWKSTNSNVSLVQYPSSLPSQIAQNGLTISVARDNSGNLSGTIQVNGTQGFKVQAALQMIGTTAILTPAPTDPNYASLQNFSFNCENVSTLTNNSSLSSTLNMTQGIGDQLLQSFSQTLSPGQTNPSTNQIINKGSLVEERDTYIKEKKTTIKDLDDIKIKLATEKERLFERFRAMAAAESDLKQFQKQLKSLMKSFSS